MVHGFKRFRNHNNGKIIVKADDKSQEILKSLFPKKSENKVEIKRPPSIPDAVYDSVKQIYKNILDAENNFNNLRKKSNNSSIEDYSPIPNSEVKQKYLCKKTEVVSIQSSLPKGVEETIGYAAVKIAKEINADCLVSVEKKDCDLESNMLNVLVAIFKKNKDKYDRFEYLTKTRYPKFGGIIPIKDLLIEAINRKYIEKGNRIVCVEDESLGSGYKGSLFIFDVDKIFFNISMHHLTDKTSTEVLESAIDIALEIGREGREGKNIGTAFVLGDRSELMKFAKQIILNPFSALPEEARKITDAGMRETLKEFSQLDGVFMIDNDGTILTAGTYIAIDATSVEMPGYGTRHRCCAALTKETDALAIVVSQSGGRVTLFKNGRIIMKLP